VGSIWKLEKRFKVASQTLVTRKQKQFHIPVALILQPRTQSKAEAFTRSFLRNSLQPNSRLDPRSVLSHKAVLLDYARPKKDKRKSKKAKGLNARQKRAMKIFQIKPEHQRFVTTRSRTSKPRLVKFVVVICFPMSQLVCSPHLRSPASLSLSSQIRAFPASA